MQSKKTSVMRTVKCLGTHIWQINWQIYPQVDLPVVLNGNFQIFTVQAHIGRSTGRSKPHIDLPVDMNGNFRFLLLELILADQLADLPPNPNTSVVASSGPEW